MNIQALIDYVNLQRNLADANNDGGVLNDGVSKGDAPSEDLYQKDGGALVVVNDKGQPVGVIWDSMTKAERDALLRDLSNYDEARIYGINQDGSKATIGIDQYILRDTEARDDSFEVEKNASLVIKAEDLLANDRVLMDEGGVFGLNKGSSNITNVTSEFEGITWDPETGEVTVDPEKYKGDADELTFTYTIQHDQDGDRNKSKNTSTSTGTVKIKINRDAEKPGTPGTPGLPVEPGTPEEPGVPEEPGIGTPDEGQTPGKGETTPPETTPGEEQPAAPGSGDSVEDPTVVTASDTITSLDPAPRPVTAPESPIGDTQAIDETEEPAAPETPAEPQDAVSVPSDAAADDAAPEASPMDAKAPVTQPQGDVTAPTEPAVDEVTTSTTDTAQQAPSEVTAPVSSVVQD